MMPQQKMDQPSADGQDRYVASDSLFRMFWDRIKSFLVDQFAGKEIPPLMMVLQQPPEDMSAQFSLMGNVALIIGVVDMRMFYNEDTKAAGKSAAAMYVRKALEENGTLLVATINEAWMVSRKSEDASTGPMVLEGAVSEQPDRQEHLMVILHSKTRQAFSLSPIRDQSGERVIDFQDYEFNNENGTMYSSYYDCPSPAEIH